MKITPRLVITALLCVCAASNAGGQEIFEESRNLYSTRPLELTVPVPPGSKISIKSATTLQGNLKISTWDKTEIKVVYTKKAKVGNRSTAIDFIDRIAVNLAKMPGGAGLEFRAPNPAPWSGDQIGSVEASIVMPASCEVEADVYYFDIEAMGPFKAFVVPSSLGRMNVSNVTHTLDLTTSNRRVNVDNISGEIQVTTSNSSLIASNVTSGEVPASFRNEGGDIKIIGVDGEINVRNSYGRTEIDQFAVTGKKSYVRCDNGPVDIRVTKVADGQLIVTNRFEDIDIFLPSNISAEFSLAVEAEGKIEVSNFPFKPNLVTRNRLHLVAGSGKALVSGSIRGKGNVYVRGYNPEEF